MRFFVRTALVAAVAAVASVVAPLAPSQAATGEWVIDAEPSASATVRYFMHKHVDGHPGNWHIFDVRVQQDDDGVTGSLISLRCPKGVQPDPVAGWADCAQVGGADFVDPDYSISVTWSPRLRYMQITGDIVLEDYVNGVLVPSTIDLRLRADGEFTRTVTRQSFTEPDPWDSKQIDIARDGVTAHGQVGWLKATRTPITFTRPLQVYSVFTRGYGDGV